MSNSEVWTLCRDNRSTSVQRQNERHLADIGHLFFFVSVTTVVDISLFHHRLDIEVTYPTGGLGDKCGHVVSSVIKNIKFITQDFPGLPLGWVKNSKQDILIYN